MPRRKRSSSPYELFDDDLDDDSQSSRNGNPPIQRNAANARERARMRVLSSAFGRLKTKLPNIPPDTKLSKLDTLRLATMYIKQLREMAEGNSTATNGDTISSMQFAEHGGSIFGLSNAAHNLSWPFGLHNIQNPTNRQMSFHHQCSSMDWHPTTSATDQSKCPRLQSDNDTFSSHQPSSLSSSFSPWYSTQNSNLLSNSHNFHSNNFNLSNNNFNNQIAQQNSQISHTYSTNSTYHQNTMSPIR